MPSMPTIGTAECAEHAEGEGNQPGSGNSLPTDRQMDATRRQFSRTGEALNGPHCLKLKRKEAIMIKNAALLFALTLLLTGCREMAPWVIRVQSSPTGARILSSTRVGVAPAEYQGITPCDAIVSAYVGGRKRGFVSFLAVPPTNAPGLQPQTITLEEKQLPHTLFFNLDRPLSP